MEAGIEHLGRATAIGVDEMIVVVEASQASLETADRVKKLAHDIGLTSLRVIGNRIQSTGEKKFLIENIKDIDMMGFIDFSDEIRKINIKEASA
jgi:CO dehydrogenase maturation factor